MASHQPTTQPRVAHERHAEVQDFMNRLARGISAGKGKQVADLWGIPAAVIGGEIVSLRSASRVRPRSPRVDRRWTSLLSTQATVA